MGIALALLAAAALALELVFVVSAASESGCGLCHAPSRAKTELERSSHRAADCSSCHRMSGVAGAVRYNLQAGNHLVAWLTRRAAPSPRDARDVGAACSPCHAGLERGIVSARGVRMSHRQVVDTGDDAPRYRCTDCHPRVAHAPAPGGRGSLDSHSACLSCHDGVSASRECRTCHADQSIGTANAATVQTAPGKSAHTENWATGHGLGDQRTCPLCHPRSDCRRCHKVSLPHDPETYRYTHGKEAAAAGKACFACHNEGSCDACHQVPMPHGTDYAVQHGKQALQRGTALCAGCHASDSCTACHLRHFHPGVATSLLTKLAAVVKAAEATAQAGSPPTTTDQGS